MSFGVSYGTILSDFWTKGTGKRMRPFKDVRILATYLMSGGCANMLGLYYLPKPTACHETGLTVEEFDVAMEWLGNEGFAHYDDEDELVWVTRMASFRMGDTLSAGDKRVPWIRRELERYREHPFAASFVGAYAQAFNLGEDFARTFKAQPLGPPRAIHVLVAPRPRSIEAPSPAAQEAPSKAPPEVVQAPPKSGSGSGSDPQTETERARLSPARAGRTEVPSGHLLKIWFGEERAAVLGGMPWTTPPDPHGKAETFAAGLTVADQPDLRPTMRLLFEHVKGNRPGWTDPRLRTSPAFAFGSWMAHFTTLREEIHGTAPPEPRARRMPPLFTGREPA